MSKQKDTITFDDVLEKIKVYIEDEEKIKVIQQAYLLHKKNMKVNLEKVESHI